jgi:hypothetical protein
MQCLRLLGRQSLHRAATPDEYYLYWPAIHRPPVPHRCARGKLWNNRKCKRVLPDFTAMGPHTPFKKDTADRLCPVCIEHSTRGEQGCKDIKRDGGCHCYCKLQTRRPRQLFLEPHPHSRWWNKVTHRKVQCSISCKWGYSTQYAARHSLAGLCC